MNALHVYPSISSRQLKEIAAHFNHLVAHTAPAGKTELFCRHLRALGKPLLSLDDPHNANLLALGAHPLRPTDLRPLL